MQNKYCSLVLCSFLLTLAFVPFLKAEGAVRKKVVVDFGVKHNALQVGAEFSVVTGTEKASNLLMAELIAALAKDSSLDVVEAVHSENLQSGVEKGKILGADYLVVGTIELMDVKKKKHELKTSGEVVDEFSGHLVVNLRIVDVHTAQVIYADEVSQREIECINEHSKTTPSLFVDKLKETMIKQLATRISETIWPIKIAKLYGGYAYLDRGQGGNLQRGMKIGVFIPTRPITDPNTGEVVSNTEYLVGELKVTEILPKVTKAQIIKYTMPIEPGFICRTIIKSDNKNCQ